MSCSETAIIESCGVKREWSVQRLREDRAGRVSQERLTARTPGVGLFNEENTRPTLFGSVNSGSFEAFTTYVSHSTHRSKK